MRGFQPRLRFHTFGDSSINFTLWLGADTYRTSLLVKHELVKRLHARYRDEGIIVPYPIRTLDLPAEVLAASPKLLPSLADTHLNSAVHVSNTAGEDNP